MSPVSGLLQRPTRRIVDRFPNFRFDNQSDDLVENRRLGGYAGAPVLDVGLQLVSKDVSLTLRLS